MDFVGKVGEHSQTEDLNEEADRDDAAGRETSISLTGIVKATLSPAASEDIIISVRLKWEIDSQFKTKLKTIYA